MICLSLVRLSIPIRSNTVKKPQIFLQESFNYFSRYALGCCVTAVEKLAYIELLSLCPVWSVKAVGYTATVGFLIGVGTLARSDTTSSSILADSIFRAGAMLFSIGSNKD